MLTLVLGAMGSGKSSEIQRQLDRCRLAGGSSVFLHPLVDTRKVAHRVNLEQYASRTIHSATVEESAALILSIAPKLLVIDEAHFFPDLVNCVAFALAGMQVVVGALNGKFDGTPWLSVCALLPHATRITHLTSVCLKCGDDNAVYSYRLDSSNREDVCIGSENEYEARCIKCGFAGPKGSSGN